MAKICLSLTCKSLALDMEVLEKYRKYVDLAELRIDCLDPDERLLIRHFPVMAGIPVILTVRRSIDGGHFTGGEGARTILFAKGLAHAEADRRRNFAYVDLEEDLNVPGLEEAARTFGTRIIRSWHNRTGGVNRDLADKMRKLRRIGDELVKISVTPGSAEDMIALYRLAKETADIEKIVAPLGEYAFSAGILAEVFGSMITYSGAPGQIDPKELSELYRFHEITDKTKFFVITGHTPKTLAHSGFFNTVFGIEKTDAVFIPVPSDSAKSLMDLAEEMGIAGISVTVPCKEEILKYLSYKSREVVSTNACNAATPGPQGWTGYNTYAPAFSDSLLEFLGKKDLRGRKITIIGSGDMARVAADEVYRLRGKALILSRTAAQARLLAEPYHFAWADCESGETYLMGKYSGIIIQTSSPGTETVDDPMEFYRFSGKELMMDLADMPAKTRCRRRAEEAGCRILTGYDMLHRQARYQYNYFMNKEFPPSLISRVGFPESDFGVY